MSDEIEYTVSSGNIFADLGRANPEELHLKSQLAQRISRTIRERGLTQVEAADLLGIDQPKVSALARGRLSNFSTDRLLKYVTALGNDVDIVVHPKVAAEEQAVVRVHDSVAAFEALERGRKQLGSLRADALTHARAADTERRRQLVRKTTSRHLHARD